MPKSPSPTRKSGQRSNRLTSLAREDLNPAQAEVYDAINAGVRGRVEGPFKVLLHSPELTKRVEQLGLYLRFQCKVPERLRELAICVVAQRWQASYEWYAHASLARAQGVPDDVLNAIAAGQRPDFAEEADAAVFDYATEVLNSGQVSDLTFARARALLGDDGIVDLTGLIGYYTLLAFTLNAFDVEVPDGANIPWRK